jgi:hypothetical protein
MDIIILIKEANKEGMNNLVQLSYTDRLGHIDKLTITSDGKLMMQIKSNSSNNTEHLVASVSNEKYHIVVQEILFEKYWNEIKSLNVINGN